MIKTRSIKLLALLLCAVLCAGLLCACQKKADPLSEDRFSSLTVNPKRGTVNAVVSLGARTLQEKTGQIAFLYELLPGETVSSLTSAREPLDQTRVSAYMKFQFDLFEGERSRLYSTFTVIFEDASPLLPTGHAIENPQALASVTDPFLWSESPKGLFATDASDAASLGVRHTAVSLSFSELLGEGADTKAVFGDTSLLYSSAALSRLDPQIRNAHRLGMQVTLSITPDVSLSSKQIATVMELLTERYSSDEHGIVSAIILQSTESVDVKGAAKLCFLAHHALRSRVANGRVFVCAPLGTLEATKAYFTDLRLSLSALGSIEWGACVSPVISLEAAEGTASALTPSQLPSLSSSLLSSNTEGKASYFAVCGQVPSGLTEEELAVSFAYAYRMSENATASLFFYPAHMNDAIGVRLSSGAERPLTAFFADVDAGLDEEQAALCKRLIGDDFDRLPDLKPTLRKHSMAASIGYSQADLESLYDFTTGEVHGFVGVGSASDPTCKNSSVFNAPVLYTWLDPSYTEEAGVRKVMKNGQSLASAISISATMLAQIPDNASYTARLRLEGVSKSGGILSYEASTVVSGGSWQAVTFQISDFTADADLSKPCILTLTTEPQSPVDEEYVLWVGALDVAIPEGPLAVWIPILLVVGGVLIGFLCVSIIYRLPKKRKANKH